MGPTMEIPVCSPAAIQAAAPGTDKSRWHFGTIFQERTHRHPLPGAFSNSSRPRPGLLAIDPSRL